MFQFVEQFLITQAQIGAPFFRDMPGVQQPSEHVARVQFRQNLAAFFAAERDAGGLRDADTQDIQPAASGAGQKLFAQRRGGCIRDDFQPGLLVVFQKRVQTGQNGFVRTAQRFQTAKAGNGQNIHLCGSIRFKARQTDPLAL